MTLFLSLYPLSSGAPANVQKYVRCFVLSRTNKINSDISSSYKLDSASEMRNLASIFSKQTGWDVIVKQSATLHIDRQRYTTLAEASRLPPNLIYNASTPTLP